MATAAEEFESPRQGARKRVLMRGTLFTPDGAYVIWIRDISNTGALITCKDRLPVDCDVIFKRGAIFAAAHLAWVKDSGAGVRFYRDLSDDAVASATLPIASAGE
jgi:hypothetical protein